jgi:hypothetical protein
MNVGMAPQSVNAGFPYQQQSQHRAPIGRELNPRARATGRMRNEGSMRQSAPPRREWADAEVLDVMHRATRGDTYVSIGADYGVTRSAIAGMVMRIREADLPCECTKPENRDGGMPARWWAR